MQEIEISDKAIDKVASLLQNEEDLEKIPVLKKQLVQEKATVDIQLKSNFQEQIQVTMSGLKTLQQSQHQINVIKANFNRIGKISVENKQSIENYELVNETSKIYDFFTKVNKIYNHILNFNNEVNYINQLIDEDLGVHVEDDDNDIEEKIIIDTDMKLHNLFKIHYSLNKLRDIKDQLDEYADNVSNDYKSIITKLFYPLQYVVKKFDKILEETISMLIESCKENNVELISILFKILDVEEREDLKINCTLTIVDHRVLGLIKKSMEDQGMKYTVASKIDENDNTLSDKKQPKLTFQQQQIYNKNFANIKNQLMQNNSITRLKPRNYLKWFYKVLERSVEETYRNCEEHFEEKSKESPGLYFEILDNLQWIFDDLNMVKNFIDINLVPRRWKFFQKVFDIYFKNCQKLLVKIVNMEPETLIILNILDYDKKFTQFCRESLGFKKSEIKSVIGDEQKNKLLQDYMGLIVSKMKDWMFNLKRTEEDVFLKREAPPDSDEEGLLGFEGSNVVFRMFIQQSDVAAGSGQGSILSGVIIDFCNILLNRQRDWAALVQSEVEQLIKFNNTDYEDPDAANFPGGLIEYIVALANDQIRGADFIESMKSKYTKMVSKKYASSMDEHLDSVIDGFINLSKECLETLVKIMFDDLRPPYREIFTKSWYNESGNQAKQIADTLVEYIGDFQAMLNPLLFDIIIEHIVDELLIRYLQALGNKHLHSNFSSDLKRLKIIEKIKLDVSIFFPAFDQYYEGLEVKFRIIEYFIDLIYLDNSEEIIDKFKELVIDFSDVPIDFIDKILRAKKIGSKQSDYILEECNNAKNEYLSQLADSMPTFMERLKFEKI